MTSEAKKRIMIKKGYRFIEVPFNAQKFTAPENTNIVKLEDIIHEFIEKQDK